MLCSLVGRKKIIWLGRKKILSPLVLNGPPLSQMLMLDITDNRNIILCASVSTIIILIHSTSTTVNLNNLTVMYSFS